MTPARRRLFAQVQAEVSRLARYDDESVAGDHWVRQRYGTGAFPTLSAARAATVATAWHEAGHAVAALAVGARFTSASIHYGGSRPRPAQPLAPPRASGSSRRAAPDGGRSGSTTAGRVHGITGAGVQSFVIDAAGQVAERLMNWTMLDDDSELRRWLAGWRGDGGDARRFRHAIGQQPSLDGVTAWRYAERVLAPRRLQIRAVARALLVAPRYLPYEVIAGLADPAGLSVPLGPGGLMADCAGGGRVRRGAGRSR